MGLRTDDRSLKTSKKHRFITKVGDAFIHK